MAELFGEGIGGYADNSIHTTGNLRQYQGIVATNYQEVLGAITQDLHALGHIAAGFFNTTNIGYFISQTQSCSGGHVTTGTAWNII